MQREFSTSGSYWIHKSGNGDALPHTTAAWRTAAEPCASHLPLARTGDPAHATHTSWFTHCLAADAANNILQFNSCTYSAGYVLMHCKIQPLSQIPIHI